MVRKSNPTYDDLFDSLQKSVMHKPESGDGFRTIDEWAKLWGVSYSKASQALRIAKDTERLVCKRVQRERLDGAPKTVSVFAVKAAAKKK